MSARAHALVGLALATGIVGGVFFAFSSFVMPALARVPASTAAASMRSINVTAVNPIFMTLLFGAGLAGVVLNLGSIGTLDDRGARWALAGTVVYVLGALVVTMVANVPRNEALAAMSADEAAAYWPRYLAEWTSYNHVRTVASILASACFVLARSAVDG